MAKTSESQSKIKLIIDTDPGVDDCHAILMALSSPHVQLLGLSCVTGNTSLVNGLRNAHHLLHVLKRRDVPIFRGAERALDGRQKYAPIIHGDDGFGNITKNLEIDLDLLSDEPSAVALVRLAREHRGELVVAAIGPLTNLFLAHRLDPEFSHNLKQVYIMGGNCTVPRFDTLSIGIEFNFACDPLAASIVLEEFQTKLRIVTFEMTCMSTIPYDWLHKEMFSKKETNDQARLFYDVTQFLYEFTMENENNPELYTGLNSCDAVCMACVLDESIVKQTKSIYACVEPFGKLAAGHMISDWYGHFKRQANVEIITDIDREKFLQLYRLCVG